MGAEEGVLEDEEYYREGRSYGESQKPAQKWSVDEIIQETLNQKRSCGLGKWEAVLPDEIPVGQTYELLVQSGKLATVEALLIDEGRIDLAALQAKGVDGHFPGFLLKTIEQRMVGGHQDKRLEDVRKWICSDLQRAASGEQAFNLPNVITPDELQRCKELVDDIHSRIESNNKPDAERLFQVLALFVIKSKHQRQFKMTQDFAVRRLGWVPEDMAREKARRARERLAGLIRWFKQDEEKCRIRPLIRLVKKGTKLPGEKGKASIYEMLWENWGGPFSRLSQPLPKAA